jgi:hypothetical protein
MVARPPSLALRRQHSGARRCARARGIAPHLMVTDPPYGVNYDPAWRNQAGRSIDGTTQRIATGTVIKPIGARGSAKWSMTTGLIGARPGR